MANNIEKQLKEISERLEQGVKEIFTSERYTEYLNTMSKFHNYSFNNTLLITMQKPEATLVAGYQAWQKKFNRHVKRGEKGIQIIAPAPIREKQEIEKIDPVTKEPVIGDDGQPETEIVEMVIPRFRVTTVFDVSQTEGEPIAELKVPELTGSVQFYDTFMQALQNISPVPIRMMNVEGEAKGYYHQTEKYIAIKEDMSNVQTMKTGVHEVSHALLHDREVMDAEGVLKDQTTKEVEAESIAYIVCNHFGLDTSEYSFTYIASWCESRDMKALKASMDTIRKTSAEIIGNIEEQMHELERENTMQYEEKEVSATRQEKLEQDSAEKIDETLLLHGESGRFAIYQMNTGGEHTYQFMGIEAAQKLGYTIDGKDYRMVYVAPWIPTITLDDIFERFNINRPNDFHGHSLSVSDVIVINRTAETKAYYVDSFGFEDLPDFVQQRMEILENNHTRAYPPVYKGTLAQAMEERDVDAYLDSRKLNIDCKKAIEEAIALKFDGLHLEEDAATQVLEQFGEERMTFVMANTLRELSYDGRFSRQNKDWAEHIEIPENINQGKNLNQDYVIESHPAVLDGFIDMARAEIRMQKIEQALDEAEVTITEDTRGFEADGHAGTWHTVDERAYAGEKFFFMEHDEYGSDVAGIIVSEHGQLVAEDLWNGYDAGALEAVSEYLQENGTTLYDLSEFPKDSVVTLRSGQTLTIKEIQAVQKDTWEETMAGKNESGTDVRFNFHAVSEVQLPEGIKLKMPEIHYVDNFYVMEDVNAEGVVKVNRYESLDEAMQEYLRLPNHQEKVLGIQNTETMQESMDFIRCKNGIDQLTHAYEQIGGWLNLEIYEAVNKMENMLDWNEVQIAYQVGKQYFTIQTAEDGYDYTFYNEDYQEDDGGIYDNPTIYVDEAASDILEDKGYSLEDAKVVDYEELMADVEEVQEEQMQRVQLEKNCPASIFEGFRREEAMQTYEGIAMQFTRSKGYLTIQATEEGYSFIFYDSDLHEIQSGDYDNPDASIQEAAYEILKNERMDDLECVKVDYKEFEEMTIQHSKELLQEGELRATSEIGRDEVALNGLSRAEVERGVLYHAQGILEDMGLENEVELLAARVHGSRSREELYRDDSDLDVVISYRGNIREDSFFNELNAHGIAMAGIKVDINPIAEERITLAEYMKESEAYLDQKEIEKLAVDLDNFSYEYDTYEYKDTVENREEQVEKITEDILNKKTGCLKDWLVEVSEESDIDSDVITARSLLSRLENTENFSIFTRQPEQEQPEATITFYVAECMEFPVMGEYHNNLTLEEAIKIYESIPAERMHGIKGIGFDLQDGDEDYSGEYGLMSGDRIDKDLIDMIPHYKESPLVQKAINDMEKYLNEKHGKVQEAEQTVEVKQEVSETPVKKESVSVEPNREQNKEPAKGGKGELKKSVLQSLKEFQARAKAQEQKEMATEKSKAHEKGDVEL